MPTKVNPATERWFTFESIRPKGEPVSGELFDGHEGNTKKFFDVLDGIAASTVDKFIPVNKKDSDS